MFSSLKRFLGMGADLPDAGHMAGLMDLGSESQDSSHIHSKKILAFKKNPCISGHFQTIWHRPEHTGSKYDTSGDSPGPGKPGGALWSFLVDLLRAIRNPDFDSIFDQNHWKS